MNDKHLFGYDKNHFDNLLISKLLQIDDETSLEDFEFFTFENQLKIDKGDTNICSFGTNTSINKLGILKTPTYDLDVSGSINLTGILRENNTQKVLTYFNHIGTNDIYYNNGNVGIGTSTPSSLLQIEKYGSIIPDVFIGTSSSSLNDTSTLKLGLAEIKTTNNLSSTTDISLNIRNNNTLTEVIKITADKTYTFNGDLNVNNNLFVDTINNKVGIKNTNPLGLLDIGNGTNTSFLRFNSERPWSFLASGSGSGTSLDLVGSSDKNFRIKNANNTNLATFRVSDTASSQTINLIENTSGFVGINNNNPTERLDVGGNIKASGWIRSTSTSRGTIVNIVGSNQLFGATYVGGQGWNTIYTYNYTPKLSNSVLLIHFNSNYLTYGSGTDTIKSSLVIGGTRYITHTAAHVNAVGGGGRGGALFPISCIYRNTSTSTKGIQIQMNSASSDDTTDVFFNSQSIRIIEITNNNLTTYDFLPP